MTPKEQQVAIEEACGWTVWSCGVPDYLNDLNAMHEALGVPDYLNDLNAMHEALKTLNADQMISMDYHLDVVVGNGKQGLNCEYFLWSASAAQFAEAFLRTIGKWKEAK
jgi:hypothetical protein